MSPLAGGGECSGICYLLGNHMSQEECQRQLQAAMEVMVRALASRNARLRRVASHTLANLGSLALPVLARALRDGEEAVRSEAGRLIAEIRRAGNPELPCVEACALAADTLVRLFASRNGSLRQDARRVLVAMGGEAVPALVAGLQDAAVGVRWESAKALSEMADPRAAGPLVAALEDSVFDVRWLAGEALVNLGEAALAPLLGALVARPRSTRLQEGAHHVLRALAEHGYYSIAAPVVRALEGFDPTLGVGPVAFEALQRLEAARPREHHPLPAAEPSAPERVLRG